MTLGFSIVVAALCAIPGARAAFARAARGEDEIRRRRMLLLREDRASRQSLRVSARWSLFQKREAAKVLEKIAASEEQVEKLRDEISQIQTRPIAERWIIEGSLRQMSGRYAFHVKCNSPIAAFGRVELPDWSDESWRVGRCILMSGASSVDARRRLEAKYPFSAGFEITTL